MIYLIEPATVQSDGSRAIVAAACDGTIVCHKQDGDFLWKQKTTVGFPFNLAVGDYNVVNGTLWFDKIVTWQQF